VDAPRYPSRVPDRLPLPGPSFLREQQLETRGRVLRVGMSQPTTTDDGWWLAIAWVSDAEGVVSFVDLAPAGGPRPEHENAVPRMGVEAAWHWTAPLRSIYPQHFACFGLDGQTFVGGHPEAQDSPTGVWRFNGELVRAFDWMSDWTVNDMAFSADGRFLAAPFYSGSAGYEVALVDLRAEPPPALLHLGGLRSGFAQRGSLVPRLTFSSRLPTSGRSASGTALR